MLWAPVLLLVFLALGECVAWTLLGFFCIFWQWCVCMCVVCVCVGRGHKKKCCFLFLMIFCCFSRCSHSGIFQHGRRQDVNHQGNWVLCCNPLWSSYTKQAIYPLVQIPGGNCTPTPSLLRCLLLKGCVGIRNQSKEIPWLWRHRQDEYTCNLKSSRKWFWHVPLRCLGEAHWFSPPLHCTEILLVTAKKQAGYTE